MPDALELLATAPGQLATAALTAPALSHTDLERLLQFLSEVNDVLAKSFHPLLRCLGAIQNLQAAELGTDEHQRIDSELREIQDREYYNIRLVCNRLHGLRHHAQRHIERIIENLPNPGEWWSLFARLDEQEGFVENAVRQAVGGVGGKLRSARTAADLESLKADAEAVHLRVSTALREIDSFAMIMHGEADRIGFLALTDLSRVRLAERITHIYDQRVQNFAVEGMTVMGDVFSNIHNSTIINKSLVEGSFNKAKEKGNPEAADALVKVAEEVNKSGNKDAGETFDAFNKELQAPAPKKTFLNSFWDSTTKALPTLLKLPGVAVSIAKLIEMF